MDDLQQQRMKSLTAFLIRNALDLMELNGAPAMRVKIPNTDPPVYIVVGTVKDIKLLVD